MIDVSLCNTKIYGGYGDNTKAFVDLSFFSVEAHFCVPEQFPKR